MASSGHWCTERAAATVEPRGSRPASPVPHRHIWQTLNMVEKEHEGEGPSLEMPSLGFGRKRKKAPPEPPEPPEQAVSPEPEPAPDPEPAPTQRLDPVPPAPAAPPLFVDEAPAARPTAVAQAERDQDEPAPGVRKQRQQFTLPQIGGMAASILTGALVGLLTVGATWGSLRLCEVVQGTPSCGNPGFFLLLAIMVAMVLIGQALLKAFDVPDPGSTSFLAMGLVAVVALLFLIDLLFLWWMVLAIPAVAMASYALAHWVTTSLVEPFESNQHR